ncbi:MAG: hypothetical protein K8J08_02050 [Thermoanaerobaculia bacterium]|nr:hypothetical protein [Thermoanaerobaculia bacterium]
MVSYRFCRPDDLPLLVRAINECYDRHFKGRPLMTEEAFRSGMREINLWPSNCMVAMGKDGPVGVSVATKRVDEVLVRAVGVLTQYQHEGHGRHLVTSLRQKLAVLGPERLVAEVARGDETASEFLGSIGFVHETDLWNWERPPGQEVPPNQLFGAVTVAELDAAGELVAPPGTAWERQIETLRGRAESLRGIAVATPERLEAWILHRQEGRLTEIVGWGGAAEASTRSRLFDLLCRRVEGETGAALRVPKLSATESDGLGLRALGFKPAAGYYRFSGEAIPA